MNLGQSLVIKELRLDSNYQTIKKGEYGMKRRTCRCKQIKAISLKTLSIVFLNVIAVLCSSVGSDPLITSDWGSSQLRILLSS